MVNELGQELRQIVDKAHHWSRHLDDSLFVLLKVTCKKLKIC